MGNIYYGQDKIDLAVKEYEKALRVNPDDLMVHRALGFAYQQTGRYQKAITMYQSYLELSTNEFEKEEILETIENLEYKLNG